MNGTASSYIDCLTCKSLQGELTLSPAGVIYSGRFWQVEHAYPTAILGWLIVILKRHVPALHNLQPGEWAEFARLYPACIQALHNRLDCSKEYAMCFAEQKGFQHIHFHLVAKPPWLPASQAGSRITAFLNVDVNKAVPVSSVERLSEALKTDLLRQKLQ